MGAALHVARFEEHGLLEPGEPAAEELLIEVPDEGFLAFRLQLWVSSTKGESWEVTESGKIQGQPVGTSLAPVSLPTVRHNTPTC